MAGRGKARVDRIEHRGAGVASRVGTIERFKARGARGGEDKFLVLSRAMSAWHWP